MLRSTTVTPALLLALAWCGPDDARPGRAKRGAKEAPAEAPAPRRAQAPEVVAPPGRPGLVLFVVLDTVRADHTSLCGHDRPTTPFLQALAGQQGWSHTCGLVTPGTWTLPSHASFFTGLLPTEHRLITKGHPLPPGVPTLAERFAAEGYQTVLLSANPTLNKASGIGRGFEVFESSPGLYAKSWRGKEFGDHLDRVLDGLDRSRPLFLFVNLFDAHDPYPAVPAGVDWVPKQPGVDINPHNPKSPEPLAFMQGTMRPAEQERYLRRLRDTYDYGIFEADKNLKRVVSTLKDRGLLEGHVRAVITSDHGENLGEHELVRHDGPPWETVVRVPLLLHDSVAGAPALPSTLSGLVVHDFLAEGRLPEAKVPASYAVVRGPPTRMRQDSVALWPEDGTKWMWVHDRPWRHDLAGDPAELQPQEATGTPAAEAVQAELAALRAVKASLGGRADPAMLEALRAVGYLDDDLGEAGAAP